MALLYYSGYLVIISIVAFLCYGIDKGQARRGGYRISEKFLLTLSILGGAFGGLFGMIRFRHKTKHLQFIVVNYLGIVLHSLIAVLIAIYL